MTNIFLCVQLLGNPDDNALSLLDNFMAKQGYVRTIAGAGPPQTLPKGLYAGTSNDTARNTAVELQVAMNASGIWQRGSVFFVAAYSDWGMAIDGNAQGVRQ